MAYELTDRVLQDPYLRPTPRLVLAVLASFTNRATMQCWPGIRRIMRMTGMAERTVLRAIDFLRTHGYIETAKGGGEAGTTLYTLHPEKWPRPATSTCQIEHGTTVEIGGSDLPSCKHNGGENGEDSNSKNKSKAKTCDKSQEEQTTQSSTTMGKSNNGVEIHQKKEKTKETSEKKNIATHGASKLVPIPSPAIGTSKLGKLWIEHAEKHDVTACLTMREGKMLRDAAQKIEYANMQAVIPVVIAEWKAFTDFCFYKGVALTLPKVPQVAFFVKFIAMAFEFAKQRQRKAELKIELKEREALLLQLQAQREGVVKAITVEFDEPLTMARKKEIMGIESRHIAQWEKVFGPVTDDYTNPAFEPNAIYDEFREDPKINLPSPGHHIVVHFKEYIAGMREARLQNTIRSDKSHRKIQNRIAELESSIKGIESSLKAV